MGSSLEDQELPRTPLPSSTLSIHRAEGCLVSLLQPLLVLQGIVWAWHLACSFRELGFMEKGKEKVLLVNKTLHKNGGSNYFLFLQFLRWTRKGCGLWFLLPSGESQGRCLPSRYGELVCWVSTVNLSAHLGITENPYPISGYISSFHLAVLSCLPMASHCYWVGWLFVCLILF